MNRTFLKRITLFLLVLGIMTFFAGCRKEEPKAAEDPKALEKLAIVSIDYHIATGELLFKAEAVLRANAPGNEKLEVISNAAWKGPLGHTLFDVPGKCADRAFRRRQHRLRDLL